MNSLTYILGFLVANVICSENKTVNLFEKLDNPCYGREEGFARDLASCERYYYCKDGNAFTGECDLGLVFDAESELCVSGENADRVCFRCSADKSYELISVPSACSQFIRCFNGYPTLHVCPGKLVFDGRSGIRQCNKAPPQGDCFRENPNDIDQGTCPPIYNEPVYFVDPKRPSVYVSDNSFKVYEFNNFCFYHFFFSDISFAMDKRDRNATNVQMDYNLMNIPECAICPEKILKIIFKLNHLY